MARLTKLLNQRLRLVPRYQLALFIALSLSSLAAAQTNKKGSSPEDTKAVDTMKNAASKGFQLSASTNVSDQASVEAVMLPPSISKKIFGKEVGSNYAVVQLIITNRSTDAALLVHSIVIDDSQWLLSGGSPYEVDLLCSASDVTDENGTLPPANAKDQNEGETQVGRKNCGVRGNTLPLWETQTRPNQIASAELRLVRGELLDTQPWTTRNWIIRALQVTGSIASGFTFVTGSQSWIRGIGAFNGQVVPGAQTFWPDSTVGQMNRISDVGFQVNKVIAKQNSDVIVAFFPIDRFITPGLKNLFLKSPSVFFAPYVMMFDSQVNGTQTSDSQNSDSQKSGSHPTKPGRKGSKASALSDYINQIFSDDQLKILKNHLYDVTAGKCTSAPVQPAQKETAEAKELERACETADLINHLSLNTVRVLVGGTMTVDVDTVPANITSVEVDTPAEKTASTMWQAAGNLTGVIRGSFLSNGTPVVVGSDDLGIKIVAVSDGSTDTALHFKITLSKPLPGTPTKLTFQVKKTKGGTSVQSATYDYPLSISASSSDKTTAPKAKSEAAPEMEKPKTELAPSESKDQNK